MKADREAGGAKVKEEELAEREAQRQAQKRGEDDQ